MDDYEKWQEVIRRNRKTYAKWHNIKNKAHTRDLDRRWLIRGGAGYDAFIKDVGLAPSMGHTLIRLDKNKPYQKGNVAWVPKNEINSQPENQKHFVTHGGANIPIVDAAAMLGIKPLSLSIKLARWAKKHKRNTFTLEELS